MKHAGDILSDYVIFIGIDTFGIASLLYLGQTVGIVFLGALCRALPFGLLTACLSLLVHILRSFL